MAKTNIRWYSRQTINKLSRFLRQRMAIVALLMVNRTKGLITTSNLGGTNPSQPGQPPHSGTGALRNSISYQTRTGLSSVSIAYGVFNGPAAAYARRLELGFSGIDGKGRNYNQAPRPFLNNATLLNKAAILRIIRRG